MMVLQLYVEQILQVRIRAERFDGKPISLKRRKKGIDEANRFSNARALSGYEAGDSYEKGGKIRGGGRKPTRGLHYVRVVTCA